MRLAVASDLHWGLDPAGDRATRDLARYVEELAPDAFAIAGDVGEGECFVRCLDLFQDLKCLKLVVPGNHDLWTREPATSSLERYEKTLPEAAAATGFHYLDRLPVVSTCKSVAIVGSINWYDYSFADPAVEREHPEAPEMYRAKRFPNGQHNDGRFVHLQMSDSEFTGQVVTRFAEQLGALPATVSQVVTIQHHPPVRELFYPTPLTNTYQRFWLAYTGNRRMQEAVLTDARVQIVICGHTHAACTANVEGKRCINIGGDYQFKRLLLLDTESGAEQWWDFGN